MPQFDLRGIKCAPYINTNGVITYGTALSVGDAMTANLELRFAEGRLYAESVLAEYMRKATGGSISLGVKYIPDTTQKAMFGSTETTRSVTPAGGTATTVKSLALGAKTTPKYVGLTWYAPDMVDGVEKFTCVFVKKALFGPPSMSMQTAGENITFNTPVTTGEFLASDASSQEMMEVVVCDTEALAIAWCTTVLA